MNADVEVEVVVIGAGLLGLATALAVGRAGHDVVVLEQAAVGHERAGSKGTSRIFRLGYEEPHYVTMARLAQQRWRDLEIESGSRLLVETGQLSFGPPSRLDALETAMRAAGAPVERLPAEEVRRRYASFAVSGPALYEPDSGVLAADRCLAALRGALPACASLRESFPVRRITDDGRRVAVETEAGLLTAHAVVCCAGPWSAPLLATAAITLDLTATLEQAAYFDHHDVADLPVFIDHEGAFLYGLPTPDRTRYKVAFHGGGPLVTNPALVDLAPDQPWLEQLTNAAARWLPELAEEPATVERCLYDNSPDGDFVIDRIGRIVIGAGTSGHGFKFGPLLGELLADLALDRPPAVDLGVFSARRA